MKRIIFLALMCIASVTESLSAQTTDVDNNRHLFIETNVVLVTRNNRLLPFSCAISPVYQINQIVSVSLTA